MSSAAAVSTAAIAAVPQMSDEEILSSMGLSAAVQQALLSSPDALLSSASGDLTVEQFLQQQCDRHVAALQDYCNRRVDAIQTEGQQAIQLIKAQYAQ
jgi:hypothetical protein